MKFLAKMNDGQHMKEFHNIILTLSKLSKDCVMKITADSMLFIANEESGSTAPVVWIEITAAVYFIDYVVSGLMKDCNSLLLSIIPANFSRALSALKANACNCKFKLINLQFPCIRVEAVVALQNNEQVRQIVHDVPVTIIPHGEWDLYNLPRIPDCDLILNINSNLLMRNLIDKIKNISPTIVFKANRKGDMNLISETEMATITTHFRRLTITANRLAIKENDDEEGKTDGDAKTESETEASCLVDCRKTAMFFSALQVPLTELLCGLKTDQLIHMQVNVRNGVTIHSILPAMCF